MKKDYIDAMNEYTEADKPEADKSEADKPGLWENIQNKKG